MPKFGFKTLIKICILNMLNFFLMLKNSKITQSAGSWLQMFSFVWKPDEIPALVFEMVLQRGFSLYSTRPVHKYPDIIIFWILRKYCAKLTVATLSKFALCSRKKLIIDRIFGKRLFLIGLLCEIKISKKPTFPQQYVN